MPKLEETETAWRFNMQDPARFDRILPPKELTKGITSVKVSMGRIRGTMRWEIQSYILEKTRFKAREQVLSFIDSHLKGRIQTLLDFKSWDEWRRRFVNAYVQSSKVSE
jgi:hypothetical protein